MSLLPVYDEILSLMNGEEITLNQSYCTTIAKLSQEHLNIIYLLILHHYITKGKNKTDLPYNAKTISNGKGVTFRKLSQIPDDLQKIIYRYLMIIS